MVFRQYIPSKRARFGIKSFLLCEAGSGYVWKLMTYTGEEKQQADAAGLPVTHSIVRKLMSNILGMGYHLYMDNYYNSPGLTTYLSQQDTHITGTLRSNRKGVPKDILKNDDGRYMQWYIYYYTVVKKIALTMLSSDLVTDSCASNLSLVYIRTFL